MAGSKTTPGIGSRIQGRLVAMDVTGTHNRELGSAVLRESCGDRLAVMVERGNITALDLARTIAGRRRYVNACNGGRNAGCNPAILEAYDRRISTLSRKLGLGDHQDDLDVSTMLRIAGSGNSYHSRQQFSNNLTEGLLLNITTLASGSLAIPAGQYLVWATSPKTTMLVPTKIARESSDRNGVVQRPQRFFDIMTSDLVSCWNKVERVIGENAMLEDIISEEGDLNYENPPTDSERTGRPALKKRIEDAGGVRATAQKTGLSPGDVSKHASYYGYNPSPETMEKYITNIGATPDDFFRQGAVTTWDYETTGGGEKRKKSSKSGNNGRSKSSGRRSNGRSSGGRSSGGRGSSTDEDGSGAGPALAENFQPGDQMVQRMFEAIVDDPTDLSSYMAMHDYFDEHGLGAFSRILYLCARYPQSTPAEKRKITQEIARVHNENPILNMISTFSFSPEISQQVYSLSPSGHPTYTYDARRDQRNWQHGQPHQDFIDHPMPGHPYVRSTMDTGLHFSQSIDQFPPEIIAAMVLHIMLANNDGIRDAIRQSRALNGLGINRTLYSRRAQ